MDKMFLSGLAWLTILGVIPVAWKATSWLGAKADSAEEDARRKKLENDKLELEVEQLRDRIQAEAESTEN